MRMLKFMAPMALALVLCASAQAAEKFNGTIGAKPADAKDPVVATLSVKKPEAKTYSLSAEGDVAKKVTELAGKGGRVSVSGTVSGDTIKVTDITEAPAKKAK